MRARKIRGRPWLGGKAPRVENASYSAVHARARSTFRGQRCALADNSCKGRIEVALRVDVFADLLVTGPSGPYYAGLNTEDAYRPLCRSHHGREGALRAAADRSAAIAGAIARDRLAGAHDCTGPTCLTCSAILSFDVAAELLVATEADVIRRRAHSTGA
jgi:hypothetical protein